MFELIIYDWLFFVYRSRHTVGATVCFDFFLFSRLNLVRSYLIIYLQNVHLMYNFSPFTLPYIYLCLYIYVCRFRFLLSCFFHRKKQSTCDTDLFLNTCHLYKTKRNETKSKVLEAFTMNNRWTRFVVFLLADPHRFECIQ